MCPPTQSIAAVPTTDSPASSLGMPVTSPRPIRCAGGLSRLRHPQTDVVHLDDQGDDAVHDDGDHDGDDDEDDRPRHEPLVEHVLERDDDDLAGEDEVGADRPGDRLLLLLRADAARGQVVSPSSS